MYLFNGRLPTEKAHGLQIVKMCEAFAEDRNEVILLSAYRRNPIKQDFFSFYGLRKNFDYQKVPAIDISWLPGRLAYYIQTLLSALILVLWSKRYQGAGTIFYARDYWTLFFLSVFGPPFAAEIHDYRFKKPRRFIQLILNRAKKVIANSRGTKELLLKHYKVSGSKMLVAPNGVDLDQFNIPQSREEVRKELGFPAGIIVGHVGRLETAGMDKGVGRLIEAVSVMRHKEAILYIIGGPNNHVEYFKGKAKKLGIEQRVVFVGQVAHAIIPRYLRAMDIVVIPLDLNQHALTTSPMKLFEYMAAGKVIIASDLPGLKEIIDPTTALFFKPGDASGLALQLDRIISDPSLATSLASHSLKRAEKFSWSSRARAIKSFIESDGS